MLHANICESRKLSKISLGAETLYYRLLTQVDDGGNFYYEAAIIRGRCFPLRAEVTDETVSGWRDELVGEDLLLVYDSEDEKYVHFDRFSDFQYLRSDRPGQFKYPSFNEKQDGTASVGRPVDARKSIGSQAVVNGWPKLSKEKSSKVNLTQPNEEPDGRSAVCESQNPEETFRKAKKVFHRIVGKSLGSLGQREREWSGLVARHGDDVLEAVEIWAREKKEWLKKECDFPLSSFFKNAGEYVDLAIAKKSPEPTEAELSAENDWNMPTVEDDRPPDWEENQKGLKEEQVRKAGGSA